MVELPLILGGSRLVQVSSNRATGPLAKLKRMQKMSLFMLQGGGLMKCSNYSMRNMPIFIIALEKYAMGSSTS